MRKILESIVIIVLAGIVLFALARIVPGGRQTVRDEWPAMGTVAAITFRTTDSNVRDAVRETAQTVFSRLENLLSAWDPDSELSRLSHAGGTNWISSVSKEVRPCYKAALELTKRSDGAFDPTVGRRLRELGVAGASHYASFDLGAIAKGFAVDVAAAEIRAQCSLLIDLGGNLRAIGPGGWRTGVRNPFGQGFAATFMLEPNESVATSGNYERFIEKDGMRFSHIIDGRTGQHVSGIAGVTVITPPELGATMADGLSTTLFVLGPDAGAAFLDRWYPSAMALWITDTPDAPRIMATPAMADRLQDARWPVVRMTVHQHMSEHDVFAR